MLWMIESSTLLVYLKMENIDSMQRATKRTYANFIVEYYSIRWYETKYIFFSLRELLWRLGKEMCAGWKCMVNFKHWSSGKHLY